LTLVVDTPETISLGAKLALNAELRPERSAVSCGDETLSYSQLHRRSNRLARGLAALGVRAGDLVTVGLPNSVGFVEVCHAI
jgi:bile acid-coenzyme A ligase